MGSLQPLDPAASPLSYYGSELRRLREAADLSQVQLSESIYCANTLVSQVETTRRIPTRDFSERIDAALRTDGHFSRLVSLVLRSQLPSWFQEYAEMEARAAYISTFQSQLIYGLLQTEEYARAVLATGVPDDLDTLVAARMERQRILEGARPPLALVVLDEAVLYRPIGGPAVMRAQLNRLLDFATNRWTRVQVLPFAVGQHASLAGSFNVLRFDDDPDIVYTEDLISGHMTANSDTIREASLRYASLQAAALSVEDSAVLIARVMEERYGNRPRTEGCAVA
ncbi:MULTISPECIES: helix-turn-helix domain-containing protein [unclassified Streptomyces]|uniref:helix-turn-helix domain-containing protein n=1 Tax=unclassified Streptomyces TaxID=2593676 RepID=UPI000DAC8C09|nr:MULTISPECIES: helix-turn-helix transcriptional regulator [unclassified Streptomyces]PZT74929.1 XRE family transcriptional regulator [Streptomyces sp. AC1-42T]PZT82088.1 XRE family transcriptional regulator [Streptomyces sp. AC1-42W]